MLLGFGKRRLEIDEAGLETGYRRSLQSYSEAKLNLLLGITSSVCLLSYMLYTVSPQTIRLHRTENLIYTVPLVAYGIFRYLFKVQDGRHDGPVEVLLKDPVFALNGLAWFVMVVAILFIPERASGALLGKSVESPVGVGGPPAANGLAGDPQQVRDLGCGAPGGLHRIADGRLARRWP